MVKQALINYATPTIANLPAGTTDRSVYVGDYAAPVKTGGWDSCNANNVCDGTLTLITVNWYDSFQELYLDGTGTAGTTVTFANPRTGVIFHTATIDARGYFDGDVYNLTDVPCSLIAASNGVTIEAAIINAPYDCDQSLEINTVNWLAAQSAVGGSTLTLSNPDNGAMIATTTVNNDRTWRFDLDLSASPLPPCNVRVTANNGQSDHAVEAADCDPNYTYVAPPVDETEQNPYSWVSITKAQWKANQNKLTLTGKGYALETVTLTSTNTGALLGTTSTDEQESWNLDITNPTTVPCSVIACSFKRVFSTQSNYVT